MNFQMPSLKLAKVQSYSDSNFVNTASEQSSIHFEHPIVEPDTTLICQPKTSFSWDQDRDQLTATMVQSAYIVVEKCNLLKFNNDSKSATIQSFDNLQKAATLTEKLKAKLSTIFAIDHTMSIMFKMIQMSNSISKAAQGSIENSTAEIVQQAVEAIIIYMEAAICFIDCLFGCDLQE